MILIYTYIIKYCIYYLYTSCIIFFLYCMGGPNVPTFNILHMVAKCGESTKISSVWRRSSPKFSKSTKNFLAKYHLKWGTTTSCNHLLNMRYVIDGDGLNTHSANLLDWNQRGSRRPGRLCKTWSRTIDKEEADLWETWRQRCFSGPTSLEGMDWLSL